MKLLLLSLALVAVALCQDCDSDNGLIRSWGTFQDGSAFTDSLWEDKELVGWGMDGNNKLEPSPSLLFFLLVYFLPLFSLFYFFFFSFLFLFPTCRFFFLSLC